LLISIIGSGCFAGIGDLIGGIFGGCTVAGLAGWRGLAAAVWVVAAAV